MNTLTRVSEPAVKLGTLTAEDVDATFCPTIDILSEHLALFGGTRRGKSKLLEQLCRQLIGWDQGIGLVDPHGDTAEDLYHWLCSGYHKLGFKQHHIHYLDPSSTLFSFDPFYYVPNDDPRSSTTLGYQAWLRGKCEAMTRLIARQLGESREEQQKTVLFNRWAHAVLYAVGIDQGDGQHEPLSHVMSLLKPSSRKYSDIIRRVRPALETHEYGQDVLEDLDRLRAEKNRKRQEEWVGSAINRFGAIFSQITGAVFDCNAPSIDFGEIIRNRGVLIANLRPTPHGLTRNTSLTLAGLIMLQLMEQARSVVQREKREQFFLFVDEAHNFLDEDFDAFLTESAKYRMSFGLCVQHPDKLKKGDVDLLPSVMSQCGTTITFQQQSKPHAELFAESFRRDKSFEPLIHEVDRQGEIQWHVSRSYSNTKGSSVGLTETDSESIAHSRQKSRSHTRGKSQSISAAQNQGKTLSGTSSQSSATNLSITDSAGTSSSQEHSQSESESVTESQAESRTTTDGVQQTEGNTTNYNQGNLTLADNSNEGINSSEGRGNTTSVGKQSGLTKSSSAGEGSNQSRAEGVGITKTDSTGSGQTVNEGITTTRGETTQKSVAEGVSEGITNTKGHSVAKSVAQNTSDTHGFSLVPIRRIDVEQRHMGKPREDLATQEARCTQQIQNLPKRHCMVSIANIPQPFVIKTTDVHDPFGGADPAYRQAVIDHVTQAIHQHHSYYFEFEDAQSLQTSVEDAPKFDDDNACFGQ